MAEERNLGVARAQESDDTDPTKAELQRRMEEARESITQTVTEIKDTVANQYQAVKDTVTEALDWREQFRKRPVAFSVGALSAGFILGYTVAGTFTGGDYDDEEDNYPSYEETDAYATTGAQPAKLMSSPYEGRGLARPASAPAPSRSSSSGGSTGSGSGAQYAASAPYESGGGYGQDSIQALTTTGEEEPDKPGLIERFKETRAYDKLQEEVSVLGDRFIEELSNVGRNVVLPALFSKVRELFGVDLSNKGGGQQQSSRASAYSGGRGGAGGGGGGGGTSAVGGTGSAGSTVSAGSAAGGGSASGSTGSGGTSYATSENQGYQTPSPDRA